jgi:hypothetical protein
MCRDTSADLSAKMHNQQSIIDGAQSEARKINERIQARAEAYNRMLPHLDAAQETLTRAKDYARAATGLIKNQALDEKRAAKEALDEIRSQIINIQKAQKPEDEKDQVLLEALNLKISSAQSVLAQLDAQQTTNSLTRDRLHADLGNAKFELLSAKLKASLHEQEVRATALAHTEERYAQERADLIPQLDEWPHLKRQILDENNIITDTPTRALTLFAALCDLLASCDFRTIQEYIHPIVDNLVINEDTMQDYTEGRTWEFTEKAESARAKIQEIAHTARR